MFSDPLSLTVHDPDHSRDEHRYITVGSSDRFRLVIVSHSDRGERVRIISARELTRAEREAYEEQKNSRRNDAQDELRPEYNLQELLKRGVRGKYVERYHGGTNLVLLEPDVARAFSSEQAVNEALRLVIRLTNTRQVKKPRRGAALR